MGPIWLLIGARQAEPALGLLQRRLTGVQGSSGSLLFKPAFPAAPQAPSWCGMHSFLPLPQAETWISGPVHCRVAPEEP